MVVTEELLDLRLGSMFRLMPRQRRSSLRNCAACSVVVSPLSHLRKSSGQRRHATGPERRDGGTTAIACGYGTDVA
jgi:hypothetical protein